MSATGQEEETMDLELETNEKELEDRKGKKDGEEGAEGKARLDDEETGDAEGYNWNKDIIRMISDIEDDITGRMDQNIEEDIRTRTTDTEKGRMGDELKHEECEKRKGEEVVENDKNRKKKKDEEEEKAQPGEEEGDVEGYNWNNDIIKMMSDIEDDVKGRIDQSNKEELYNLQRSTGHKEEEEEMVREKTDEKEEEPKDETDDAIAKGYNWNNDIIKIISDTEDDEERRIAQRSKEDILETTPNKENKENEEKDDELEHRGDEDQKDEDTEARYIEESTMEKEWKKNGHEKEDYEEIEGKDEDVVEKGIVETENEDHNY